MAHFVNCWLATEPYSASVEQALYNADHNRGSCSCDLRKVATQLALPQFKRTVTDDTMVSQKSRYPTFRDPNYVEYLKNCDFYKCNSSTCEAPFDYGRDFQKIPRAGDVPIESMGVCVLKSIEMHGHVSSRDVHAFKTVRKNINLGNLDRAGIIQNISGTGPVPETSRQHCKCTVTVGKRLLNFHAS